MPVELERDSIRKLTHDSSEIRLRTLQQLHAKLQRALAHDEEVLFRPGELCKQLIRWFGHQPLQAPEEALQLLLLVLRSRYGAQAISDLGVQRFKRELGKVQTLVHECPPAVQLVAEVQKLLTEQEQEDEFTDCNTLSERFTATVLAEDLNNSDDTVAIAYVVEDFEPPWSKPSNADYMSLKLMAEVFKNIEASGEQVTNALQHLQVTMADYPAEYMLQTPHIFLNLLQRYEAEGDSTEKGTREEVTKTLKVFVEQLKKRLRMRYNTLAYANNAKDPATQPNTQLKVEKVLHLLVEASLRQLTAVAGEPGMDKEMLLVYELLLDTMGIYEMQKLRFERESLKQLHDLCVQLKASYEQREHFALQRIKYLACGLLLQDFVLLNGTLGDNNDELPLLETFLSDFGFKLNFPKRYECLKTALSESQIEDLKEKCSQLERFEAAFANAINILCSPQAESGEILSHSGELCLALERLQSFELLERLFKAANEHNSQLYTQPVLKEQCGELLLKLLRLENAPLRTLVYHKVTLAVRKHFACLMNNETYCSGCAPAVLLRAQVIGVPWSSPLLQQVIYEGCQGSDPATRENCSDILTLLLRTQHLIGAYWQDILELLLPLMPLLQCNRKLTKELHKLFEPDAVKLQRRHLLQGNMFYLFHPDQELRNEALTRLIYILSQSMPDAEKFVPNIMEISDVIPNDLCLLTTPREYSRIFNATEGFGELSTLENLYTILETPDIQPLIRKTSLMQLNVLCQQRELLEAFCQADAFYLPLQALENALLISTHLDYMDSAVPSISILCKAMLYDVRLRRRLAELESFYNLLLRALFLFQNDIQLREDASICLFLMVFVDYVDVVGNERIEVPPLLNELQLPLRVELANRNIGSLYETERLSSGLSNEDLELAYLRQLLAYHFCHKCVSKINKKYLESQQQYDISEELRLTPYDRRLLQASIPKQNYIRFLRSIYNATDHQTLTQAVLALQLQLRLVDEGKGCIEKGQSMKKLSKRMDDDLVRELYQQLSKYLPLLPGNTLDVELYARLLELCDFCVELPLPTLIECLTKALVCDFQHAFFTLLRNANLSLGFYHKHCLLLQHLLAANRAQSSSRLSPKLEILCANLYELVNELITQFFTQRDLQCVRCLLQLQTVISSFPLGLSDKTLLAHCRRYLNLCCALKSYAQTGAEWQRNCLQLICRLHAQMAQPEQSFQFKPAGIKYLSSLCGHNDTEMRALAWCVLSYVGRFKNNETSGLEILNTELAYLPGGFMACCLCTLLDTKEALLVRQLAGNVLIAYLRSDAEKYETAYTLLKQHDFFSMAGAALKDCCILNAHIPLRFVHAAGERVSDCGIFSTYTRICIAMLRSNDTFQELLCDQFYMQRLYELMKLAEHQTSENPEFEQLCGDICQLYGLCYPDNFEFLQRTLCRDQVFLNNLFYLLEHIESDEVALLNVMQLLMILCKDDLAFEQFCKKFSDCPRCLFKVLAHTLKVTLINAPLQRGSLALLSFLLIKSQNQSESCFSEPRCSFIKLLERKEDLAKMLPSNNADNQQQQQQQLATPADSQCPKTSMASYIFIELQRLFSHLYAVPACKFEHAPSSAQIQVTEALALLLKCSPEARSTAEDLKMFDKLLRVFKSFFDDFKCSATTFVRRHGETKKLAIIKNFNLLLNIQLNWFSAPDSCLTSDLQAHDLALVLMQLWPWLAHSSDLKLLVLRVCSHHSEQSFVVCQHFSSLLSGYANSILQLLIKLITAETNKIKPSSAECFPIISTGLRVIMNCCACTEGRVTLVKAHITDVFDGLHPFNLKSPKLKLDILNSWLRFWELFSRYPEGATVRHLNALCGVINRVTIGSPTRLLCLKILRNMTFQSGNRTALMGSRDFIYTVDAVLAERLCSPPKDHTFEEQLHVCVAMWQLISGGIKYVALVRGTHLAKRFRLLHEQLTALQEEDEERFKEGTAAADCVNVLDIILKIFSN